MKDLNDNSTVDLVSFICPVCSSLLPKSKTRSFVYCSNACKFKAFRQRSKTQRILSVSEKPQRISKKSKKVTRISPSNRTIGVSGTVLNIPQIQPVESYESVTCKSFDEVKRFFGG